ncbi:MAG: class I SAM-dependent methyltransferase [Alphaproteobacteria bacterium]|nr:class I SAM-dependent methyltransferase [Alphaproteobacteria bacterium]
MSGYAVGRFLNTLASWLPLPAPQSMADFRTMVKGRAPQVYAQLYEPYAPFKGKDVAEVGAGWGYATDYYLTREPNRYYALDVAHTDAIVAECSANPLRDRLQVVTITPGAIPLPDACVDVVISENTFEHAVEYPRTIAECHRILRPGGRLVAMWAPLFHSPYGAHLWHVIKFPWLHLMVEDDALRRLFYEGALPPALEYGHDYHWEQYATLNRLRPRDFLAPFQEGGWKIVHLTSYPIPGTHAAPEPIQSLLTHGMRIVAEKR